METNQKPILITGGTGKTGKRIAQRLRELGYAVRIGSRRSSPSFDWNDEKTWTQALDGIEFAYISYYPDLAFPGAAETIRRFTEQAVAMGVKRFVLLSGRGEKEALPSEAAVQESGVEWTVMRSSWFAQNFSEHFLYEPVMDGVIALPAGNVTEPFVDADDLAEVATIALTKHGHDKKIYELTGPRLLSFSETSRILSETLGREIQYHPVTSSQYAEEAIKAGVPAEEVEPLTDLFERVLDGRNEYVTNDIEMILGKPARSFEEYAAGAAKTGIWALPARQLSMSSELSLKPPTSDGGQQ